MRNCSATSTITQRRDRQSHISELSMTDQWYLEVVKGVPRVCRESEMALKRSRGRRGQQERERERVPPEW